MKKKTPFFAKFLESNVREDLEAAKAGATMKYPSDSDEDFPIDPNPRFSAEATCKFPSDSDEHGFPVEFAAEATNKYPSDRDEDIIW